MYVKPKMGLNRFGNESVTYEGVGEQKKWLRLESYGPKFVENIVQATARDILAEAMLRLNAAGYRIVMHVHDEAVIEAPPETELSDICSIMDREVEEQGHLLGGSLRPMQQHHPHHGNRGGIPQAEEGAAGCHQGCGWLCGRSSPGRAAQKRYGCLPLSADPGHGLRYNGFVERYEKAKSRIEELRNIKPNGKPRRMPLAHSCSEVQELDTLSEFDEKLWLTVIDTVTVYADGRMTFKFQGGTEIDA